MTHDSGFLKLVESAKSGIRECTVHDVVSRREKGETFQLIDVREDNEWQAGRARGALHLGRGVLERDIERHFPDRDTALVLYCGGGFRSALAAESLQKMGYRRVESLAGGIKAWRESGLPEER